MPLPVAHTLVGASIFAALLPRRASNELYQSLLLGALLANAADFDFALVFILGSGEWHRGFSHSLLFAVLFWICCVFLLGRRRLRLAIACGAAFASHAVLDFITTKRGGGVELLWPFSDERLRLGRFPLSEIPSQLSLLEIVGALALEFALFTPLLVAVLLLRRWSTSQFEYEVK